MEFYKKLKLLATNAKLKKTLGLLILAATIGLFIYYALTNSDKLVEPLAVISPILIFVLLTLYVAINFTNSEILKSSLEMLGHSYSNLSSFLLTSYSSIVNFFGPLQSGPGFRAIYLKNKLNVKILDYSRTLFIYYGIFALVNILIIITVLAIRVGVGYALALVAFLVLGYLIFKKVQKKRPAWVFKLNIQQIVKISVFVLVQCIITTVIYTLEIWSFNSNVSLLQTLGYTAIANLALFVALTPGAIGIRESFLFFSQTLHGIDAQTIITASIIDRSVYFLFLAFIFVLCIALNAKQKLGVKKLV